MTDQERCDYIDWLKEETRAVTAGANPTRPKPRKGD